VTPLKATFTEDTNTDPVAGRKVASNIPQTHTQTSPFKQQEGVATPTFVSEHYPFPSPGETTTPTA
jgi:hypothetical protein